MDSRRLTLTSLTDLLSYRVTSGLHDALSGEAQAREEADCVVLDAMLEAQRRLQVRIARTPAMPLLCGVVFGG